MTGEAAHGTELTRSKYARKNARPSFGIGLTQTMHCLGGSVKVNIGKIVKSTSHINYVCQIYGPLEIEISPEVIDYAFGHFVRVAVASSGLDRAHGRQEREHSMHEEPSCYTVGVIYDSQLLGPAFSSLGPRLSTETQVELFSPDYLSEQALLVHLVMLGMVEQHRSSSSPIKVQIVHGIPAFPLELNSSVEAMTDEQVHQFHFFGDQGHAENQHNYLHMGYLPHLIAQQHSLIPLVILRIIDQLEQIFPYHRSLLSILKRNFAWRLKVETTG
jgi:hypothetical protein